MNEEKLAISRNEEWKVAWWREGDEHSDLCTEACERLHTYESGCAYAGR